MTDRDELRTLQAELRAELRDSILPFWMSRAVDEGAGGFLGLVTHEGAGVPDAPKGAVLNARILWTFSAAHRTLGGEPYLAMADRARDYLRERFFDPEFGGLYWMLDSAGAPLDDRKHVYAQSFAIYGLAEYYRATTDESVLEDAIRIFRLVEQHARDGDGGGYDEAFSREWRLLSDVRLSERDENHPRSMNTHLHLLEAYGGLYRVWPDRLLRSRLKQLVRLFLDRIVDPETGHVRQFFDRKWKARSRTVSFGHDIETSWLLLEAADLIGDPGLRAEVRDTSVRMADAVLRSGVDTVGGVFNEGSATGVIDTDKVWWVQAEALVGFLNAFQETGRSEFLEAALATWSFTRTHIADPYGGEWYWRVSWDGTVVYEHEKAGPWKCPYHNARAAFEIMDRAREILRTTVHV